MTSETPDNTMITDTAALHTCSLYCDRPDCIRQQRDDLRERLAELDAARRDAARYVWLRDRPWQACHTLFPHAPWLHESHAANQERMDAAIDAAMAREAE